MLVFTAAASLAMVFALQQNAYISGTAMLGAAHAITYERPLVSDSFRLMPVAGRPGHLVRFDSAGPKHRGLASAIKDATGQKIPDGAWLRVEGDAPTGARWALMLVAVFLSFAAWNLSVTAKLLRKVS